MKEMLFNGARRDIEGKFEVSNTGGPAGRESAMTEATVERTFTPF